MKLFGRKKAKARLDEVLKGKEPPVLPQGTLRLLKLLRDPDGELEQIAEALSWDPGLVVRVLKLVNSAAFGTARTIESVQHAVGMLGRNQLEHLVLGVAVKDGLPSAPARGFDAGRFWRGAFFRGALATEIAERLHPADKSRNFIGALLQDMAVPLLAHARPDDYGGVLEEYNASTTARLHQLEKSALGFSHDEIGAHLATEWELPEPLVLVIQRHHDDAATDQDLPPALRLVALHHEAASDDDLEILVEEGRAQYGLEPDWTRRTVTESLEKATDLARSLA